MSRPEEQKNKRQKNLKIDQNSEGTQINKQNILEKSNLKIQRYNQTKDLNAFTIIQDEKTLLQEVKKKELMTDREVQNNQPLFGFFLGVKDNINIQNFPTSAGTPALR